VRQDSLVGIFIECLPLLLRALKLEDYLQSNANGLSAVWKGGLEEMNQLICMMHIIDALYTVTKYEDEIREKVHVQPSVLPKDASIGGQVHLTKFVMDRLLEIRRISPTNIPNEEMYTLMVRMALRSYATIVCHTQPIAKPGDQMKPGNPFALIFYPTGSTYNGTLDTAWWLRIVGEASVDMKNSQTNTEIRPEGTDELSALQRQHRLRSAGVGTDKLSSWQCSQMGSLSQDLSSMSRTLLGDDLVLNERKRGWAPAGSISEDVMLAEDDELNRNEAMRALVKSLFVIQEKGGAEVKEGGMQLWMQRLNDSLPKAHFNVQLFLVKLIVNYHNNIRRMASDGRPNPPADMFKPFANKLFDVFFREGKNQDDSGLAIRLSTSDRRLETGSPFEVLKLRQTTFTSFLKGICSLWCSWISPLPTSGGVRGFEISEPQARQGWRFIISLAPIVINHSSQVTNDNLYYLKELISGWRRKAKTVELDE
jgi:hypothetical protein